MKVTSRSVLALASLGFSLAAQANDVLLTVNQPSTITYRVAHANKNGQPIYGELQTMMINNSARVSMEMEQYDLAGLVIVSANGRELPSTINQFNKPQQCSMTTDKVKSIGELAFTLTDHMIKCRTSGGVFG